MDRVQIINVFWHHGCCILQFSTVIVKGRKFQDTVIFFTPQSNSFNRCMDLHLTLQTLGEFYLCNCIQNGKLIFATDLRPNKFLSFD